MRLNAPFQEQKSKIFWGVAQRHSDAAAVVFGLKFADNVQYKFKE